MNRSTETRKNTHDFNIKFTCICLRTNDKYSNGNLWKQQNKGKRRSNLENPAISETIRSNSSTLK